MFKQALDGRRIGFVNGLASVCHPAGPSIETHSYAMGIYERVNSEGRFVQRLEGVLAGDGPTQD